MAFFIDQFSSSRIEDDHEDDLQFRGNSFEKIDFILYRFIPETSLSSYFHEHVAFTELRKPKIDVHLGNILIH